MINGTNFLPFLLGVAIGVLWTIVIKNKKTSSSSSSSNGTHYLNKKNRRGTDHQNSPAKTDFVTPPKASFQAMNVNLHYLMSRLYGIIGYSNLLLSDSKKVNRLEAIRTINESAKDINHFISEVFFLDTNSRLKVLSDEHFVNEIQPLKILIVEDDRTTRAITSGLIESWGWSWVAANDGEEAIKKVKDVQFDIILLDINLPNKSGYEVAEELQKIKGFKENTRIIGISANSDPQTRKQSIESGMDDYVVKPILPPKLKRLFMQWSPENRNFMSDGEVTTRMFRKREYPSLDYSYIQELLSIKDGGLPVLFKETLNAFFESMDETIPGLQKMNIDSDPEEVRKIAHFIKGSALAIGGEDLSRRALVLEDMGRNGEKDRFTDQIEKVVKAYQNTVSDLNKIVNKNSNEKEISA